MPRTPTRTVLLADGTGTTGRRIATRLAAVDVDVRLGSRHHAAPLDRHRPRTRDAALGDHVDAAAAVPGVWGA